MNSRFLKIRNFEGCVMNNTFIEMKLFQVKPDKLEQFESMIKEMATNQLKCEGCISLKYFKRFYTIDGIELGEPPRELSGICTICQDNLLKVEASGTGTDYGNTIFYLPENSTELNV